MKLSISLPEEDIDFLDDYARAQGIKSRSGVVRTALHLLRSVEFARDYQAAWDEWNGDDDSDAWECSTTDGLKP